MSITWNDVVIKIEELRKLGYIHMFIDENDNEEYNHRLIINRNSYPIEFKLKKLAEFLSITLFRIYVYKTHIFINEDDEWVEIPKEIDDILQFTLINGRPSKTIELLFHVKGRP